MAIAYPALKFGRFNLGIGFTPSLLHKQFGVDLGERFYRDPDYRIRTTMELDRAVYDAYGRLGLGFKEPFPRGTIAPFGHRFMPVMYGCDCNFTPDSEPWGAIRTLREEEIDGLPVWTRERFEASEPVREVLEQARHIRKHYDLSKTRASDPRIPELSTQQNLGSVVNTAFSVQGDSLFMDYIVRPDTARKFYANITDLMLRCIEYFSEFDGTPVTMLGLGNCTVAMISPNQYREFNQEFDLRLIDHARKLGVPFLMHQDSDVNVHLENYARLGYVHSLDLGQDTDFGIVARLFSQASVNCMFFPSWVNAHTADEIRDEVLRLMRAGLKCREFSFTCYEVDTLIGGDRLFEFCDVFRECAEIVEWVR
jgi:hypothetical protein